MLPGSLSPPKVGLFQRLGHLSFVRKALGLGTQSCAVSLPLPEAGGPGRGWLGSLSPVAVTLGFVWASCRRKWQFVLVPAQGPTSRSPQGPWGKENQAVTSPVGATLAWHVVTGRGVGVKGYFLGCSSWPANFKGSPRC